MLALLGELLLDGGGAETELRAGSPEDGDVDRPRVKVDPLVDPAHPSRQSLAVAIADSVFGKKATAATRIDGRHAKRRQDRENKLADGWPFASERLSRSSNDQRVIACARVAVGFACALMLQRSRFQ